MWILTVGDLIISICMLAGILAIALVGILFLMHLQAKKLREVRFFCPDTKAEKGYLKFAFVTDLHFPLMPYDSGEIVRRISASDCDAVLIGGDLCQNVKGKNQMLAFMRALSQEVNVPIYVVLGNHDNYAVCKLNEDAINAYSMEVTSCGNNITVLSDEAVFVACENGKKVMVGGLRDARIIDKEQTRRLVNEWNIKAEACGAELVLLTHNPDVVTMVDDNCCSIILCGHTHGGQVYMPFNIEFKILRHDILPKEGYKYGYCDYKGKNKLFISCGAGCSLLPIRFKTAPEIVYIHI